jgi:hypothetical protein
MCYGYMDAVHLSLYPRQCGVSSVYAGLYVRWHCVDGCICQQHGFVSNLNASQHQVDPLQDQVRRGESHATTLRLRLDIVQRHLDMGSRRVPDPCGYVDSVLHGLDASQRRLHLLIHRLQRSRSRVDSSHGHLDIVDGVLSLWRQWRSVVSVRL